MSWVIEKNEDCDLVEQKVLIKIKQILRENMKEESGLDEIAINIENESYTNKLPCEIEEAMKYISELGSTVWIRSCWTC